MAKSVLGNDPFQRGAAVRPVAAPVEPSLGMPAPAPAPSKPPVTSPAKVKSSRKSVAAKKGAKGKKAPPVAPAPEVVAVEARPLAPSASEGPPPPDLGERALAMMQLTREILGQAVSSESLSHAVIAAQGFLRAMVAGLGTSGPRKVDIYGKDAELVEGLAPLTNFLYERYWRVTVENARALPRGPVMLVANHAGALPLDGPVLYEAIRRERPDLAEPRWLVEDQVFYAPFFGTLINRVGAVRACPENALRLLNEGRPVLVFPEGIQGLSKPFRERYHLKRFGRGGFVKIALRTGVPIVPVAIVGAEETLPLMAKLPGRSLGLPYVPVTPLGPVPLPAKWFIRFGDPLDCEGHGKSASEDFAVVHRLTERTRQNIESMLQAMLRDRASVFAG